MKKIVSITLLVVWCVLPALAQRTVADCTITYGISTEDNAANADIDATLKASTKTVYIKGMESRTDLVSPSFTQSLIYNKLTGEAVILREFGNSKFMTRLDHDKWTAENKRYEGMTLSFSPETKTILGYECKKAMIRLKDGSSFAIFYTTAIVPSVREFEYQFKDIPGFVLEYESQETDGRRIRYTAAKINLSPVLASKFDIPSSGYRLLN